MAFDSVMARRIGGNPAFRTMLKVELEDAAAADEAFTILMGDKVEPRREFIERNAKYVSNLDI